MDKPYMDKLQRQVTRQINQEQGISRNHIQGMQPCNSVDGLPFDHPHGCTKTITIGDLKGTKWMSSKAQYSFNRRPAEHGQGQGGLHGGADVRHIIQRLGNREVWRGLNQRGRGLPASHGAVRGTGGRPVRLHALCAGEEGQLCRQPPCGH